MPEKIIIFAPHPDDEVLGCGGVSALKAKTGAEIIVWFITDGSMLLACKGINDPSPQAVSDQRKAESKKASNVLGITSPQHYYMDYKDGLLSEHADEVTDRIKDIIIKEQPDEIYYMNAFEEHADHVASHHIVRAACTAVDFRGRNFQYVVNLKDGFDLSEQNTVSIDISSVFDLKRRAIEENQSHLSIMSDQQAQPEWTSIPEKFLSDQELFITE